MQVVACMSSLGIQKRLANSKNCSLLAANTLRLALQPYALAALYEQG
jgi:hypothetical protein